jgi:hypothetical protein
MSDEIDFSDFEDLMKDIKSDDLVNFNNSDAIIRELGITNDLIVESDTNDKSNENIKNTWFIIDDEKIVKSDHELRLEKFELLLKLADLLDQGVKLSQFYTMDSDIAAMKYEYKIQSKIFKQEREKGEKLEILAKLSELSNHGVQLSQNYTMNSDIDVMKREYNIHTSLKEKQSKSKDNAAVLGMLLGMFAGYSLMKDKTEPGNLNGENMDKILQNLGYSNNITFPNTNPSTSTNTYIGSNANLSILPSLNNIQLNNSNTSIGFNTNSSIYSSHNNQNNNSLLGDITGTTTGNITTSNILTPLTGSPNSIYTGNKYW